MSDNPNPEDDKTPTPTPPAPPAQETNWKAEAQKWEKRARENKDASEKLKAYEDAQKSEAQKQADALTEALKRADAAEARNAIVEAAANAGIPVALMAGPGEDPAAYAAALQEWKGAQTPPSPDPAPGAGKTPVDPGDVTLDEQIATATKAKDWDTVANLKALKLGQLKPS